MRLIALSLIGLFIGSLQIVYGTLMAWRPDLFLRFHDTFVDRGKWSRHAAWRKDVHNLDFKVLGFVFVVVGLFLVFMMLSRLISPNRSLR